MLSKLSGQCVQNVELPTWMEQTEMWTRRGELRSIHSIQRKCSFYEVVKTFFLPKSLGQKEKYVGGNEPRSTYTHEDPQKMWYF